MLDDILVFSSTVLITASSAATIGHSDSATQKKRYDAMMRCCVIMVDNGVLLQFGMHC